MFGKYTKIIYLAMFLFYIIMPLYMFLFSNNICDYAIATFTLSEFSAIVPELTDVMLGA